MCKLQHSCYKKSKKWVEGKSIRMLVGDFGEDYETMVSLQALHMAGH
jgi:hypothetical protein